jgi:hypothetical protein
MPDAAMPPVPPINRTEVDGVRTLWIDEPGPLIATLAFRVGRSDEPTPQSGITHIVEHLALAGLGVQDYDHNGFVDGQQTVFTSIGRPDEVKTFLEEVVRGLTNPPLDRLLLERRILREERNQRGPSIGAALRWYRFGYAGQGRALGPGDDELALDWLGPGPVADWIQRWFTRQNAILWLTGPVPEGLRLELPDGEPSPTPDITPVPGVTFPTHLAWDGPAATLGYIAPRTSAIHIASSIAHRRARQRLRFDQGLVYDVELDYEPVAPTVAHVMLGASCPDERIRQVTDGLLGIVRQLATDGPTQHELDQEQSGYRRGTVRRTAGGRPGEGEGRACGGPRDDAGHGELRGGRRSRAVPGVVALAGRRPRVRPGRLLPAGPQAEGAPVRRPRGCDHRRRAGRVADGPLRRLRGVRPRGARHPDAAGA